ncbi:MAG: SRPBCC domain-containing protein [Bacteroidota bacterium]
MVRSIIVIMFSMPLLMSCYAKKKAIESGRPYNQQINWPEQYVPEQSKFYVHNKVDIEAPAEVVWDILLQAETWPEWYEGAANVKVQNSTDGRLKEGSVFTWKTMGLDFQSTIKEYVPNERLSWESRKKSIKAYHSWLIIPNENGVTLVTDESQYGWLTFLEKTFQRKKLQRIHDIWLAEIKKKAEQASK